MDSVADHLYDYDDGKLDDLFHTFKEKLQPYREYVAADFILLFDSFVHIAAVAAKSGTDMKSLPEIEEVRSRLEGFLQLPVFDLLTQADKLLAAERK